MEKVTIKTGFLPCGTDPTGEEGNMVIDSRGRITFNAPHNFSLHNQIVPPEKIPQIQWDEPLASRQS